MRRSLALVVALTSSLLLAVPAHAQLTVTQDEVGDGRFDSDFKKVTVDHSVQRVRLTTRMVNEPGADSELPDEVWHLVDTRGDRQPDLLVFVVVSSETTDHPLVYLRRTDAWPPRRNPYQALDDENAVECGLHRSREREHGRLLRTTIGRGCLRTDGSMPQRLRVNTFGTLDSGRYTDVVKGYHRYGSWITSD